MPILKPAHTIVIMNVIGIASIKVKRKEKMISQKRPTMINLLVN